VVVGRTLFDAGLNQGFFKCTPKQDGAQGKNTMKNIFLPTAKLAAALFAAVLAFFVFTGCPGLTDDLKSSFEPVTGISGVPLTGTAGAVVDLGGAKVVPENATHQAISWAVVQAGGTGVTTAGIVDNKFTPSAAGNLVLSASVENGKEEGLPYTREFTIKIEGSGDTDDDDDDKETPAAITYTVTPNGANGTETTTAITFTFSGAVELAAGDITVANVTGEVTKGDLSREGTAWSLALNVAKAGDITVSVAKDGVESGAKTVIVFKEDEVIEELAWTATANGAAGSATSTAITFTFGGAVTGLTLTNITVTNDTGVVTPGDLTVDPADGKIWTLALTAVAAQGNVKVSVTRAGVKAATQTVAVYKFVPVSGISGVPETGTAGAELNLGGAEIEPATATAAGTAITWTVKDAGGTGVTDAGIVDNKVTPANAGNLVLTASVANGKEGGAAYTQEFTITINPPFVPVSGISGVPEAGAMGEEVDLGGAEIEPDTATAAGTAISWTVKDAGGTGVTTESIVDDKFTPASAGTLVLTASVANGTAEGTPYTREFTIEIGLAAGAKKEVTAAGVSFNLVYVPPVTDGFKATDAGFTPKISKGYWMGETEVTRELWQAVMTGTSNSATPSIMTSDTTDIESGTAGTFPVNNFTWYDCMEFCNELSAKAGKDPVYAITSITRDDDGHITAAEVTWDVAKNGYRLPTWAEWMWAAMGATKGGDTVKQNGYLKPFAGAAEAGGAIDADYVWYRASSGRKLHHVGLKLPNELGLYDMSGNMAEWTWTSIDASNNLPHSGYSGDGTDYRDEGDNVALSSKTFAASMGQNYDANTVDNFILKNTAGGTQKITLVVRYGLRVVCGE
jgi:formylglycine-generating enzyme required for sulfatase activity